MAEIRRMKPEEARRKAQSGEALFVCAYDDEDLCNRLRLEDSLTLAELKTKLADKGKEQEIIFYCQ